MKKESKSQTKKPERPEHVPLDWGEPGAGGYFSFQKQYLEEKKKDLGEKFVRKDEMTNCSAAWKTKDPKWKWTEYGVTPAPPK